jgi:translation initiation factor IF-2
MRVYEFSKHIGIPNKEILELLRKAGFEITSHMSILDQKCIDFLNKERLGAIPAMETSVISKQNKPVSAVKIKPEPAKKVVASVKLNEGFAAKPGAMSERIGAKKPTGGVFHSVKNKDSHLVAYKPVIYAEPMTAGALAEGIEKPLAEIIIMLLRQGIACNKNQLLSKEVVKKVTEHFEIILPERPSPTSGDSVEKSCPEDKSKGSNTRPPVLVVIGHVDHGKTTLLDYIRKTRVAAKEKGGITQHVGAYQVKTNHGAMTFLDTPGHEAFSMIRVRGIRVADIAILVVAADDGVMPQTIEAIDRAKEMNIPIVVAINKADRVSEARIEEVKGELSRHGLLADDWGGQTICIPVSAKTGVGVDELLEYVAIYSQDLSLGADNSAVSAGVVIDARIERGRGAVATFIARQGTLCVGDYFVCGSATGKVNSIIGSSGEQLKQVTASIPVCVVGFSSLPQVGEVLKVVSFEEYRLARDEKLGRPVAVLPANHSQSGESINIMIKADSDASREAIVNAILQLKPAGKRLLRIVSAHVGDINESDVEYAQTTTSTIYGFGVKVGVAAQSFAKELGIVIKRFGIIYQLLDDLVVHAKDNQAVVFERKKIGEAEVLKVFDIKGVGVVAGCAVRSGRFVRDGFAIAWRGKTKIGEGAIKSLQRDKKNAKEVNSGFECAFFIEGLTDWTTGDRVECFAQIVQAA